MASARAATSVQHPRLSLGHGAPASSLAPARTCQPSPGITQCLCLGLLEDCRGKELLPEHVKAYATRQVLRVQRASPRSLGVNAAIARGLYAPGSASAAAFAQAARSTGLLSDVLRAVAGVAKR